jgi:4-hydroxy-tetrahydrodipicolinate synthase
MADLSLRGAYTALVTPFVEDGSSIDFGAFDELVGSQLAGGVSGLVPCGTTGESPTLTHSEQRELVKRTVNLAKGRIPVLAGTGSNNTKKTIEDSKTALEAGADGVMIVMPYYSKPSQEGLIHHISLVAKAVGAPVVLYNIPGRTNVDLSVESLVRVLEENPNVVGLKDSTANVLYCQELLAKVGDRVRVLSGDDGLCLPLMSVGARGVISVASNLYPKQVADVVKAIDEGRWDDARRQHFQLLPVYKALFMEPNPQPVKAALALKGKMQRAVRPPLIEASDACRAKLAEVMDQLEAS